MQAPRSGARSEATRGFASREPSGDASLRAPPRGDRLRRRAVSDAERPTTPRATRCRRPAGRRACAPRSRARRGDCAGRDRRSRAGRPGELASAQPVRLDPPRPQLRRALDPGRDVAERCDARPVLRALELPEALRAGRGAGASAAPAARRGGPARRSRGPRISRGLSAEGGERSRPLERGSSRARARAAPEHAGRRLARLPGRARLARLSREGSRSPSACRTPTTASA